MDRGAWRAEARHGVAESDTAEGLRTTQHSTNQKEKSVEDRICSLLASLWICSILLDLFVILHVATQNLNFMEIPYGSL